MRDINRIPIIMKELELLWKEKPDLRFYQVIEMLLDLVDIPDPFYLEDDKWLEIIKKVKTHDFSNKSSGFTVEEIDSFLKLIKREGRK